MQRRAVQHTVVAAAAAGGEERRCGGAAWSRGKPTPACKRVGCSASVHVGRLRRPPRGLAQTSEGPFKVQSTLSPAVMVGFLPDKLHWLSTIQYYMAMVQEPYQCAFENFQISICKKAQFGPFLDRFSQSHPQVCLVPGSTTRVYSEPHAHAVPCHAHSCALQGGCQDVYRTAMRVAVLVRGSDGVQTVTFASASATRLAFLCASLPIVPFHPPHRSSHVPISVSF
jgi:hypothetical protein